MVSISIKYEGQLRCGATHDPSAATLITDAPVDNCGKGESFSPTDLVATGLGSCVLTIMGIIAERNDIDISGTTVNVEKGMVVDPVRRIGSLKVQVQVPRELSESDRKRLEHGALTCPVHKSLHPDIDAPITFSYGR
ncbi:osmotically inducible protein OsmC [bacterium F16]|nr:osmotically inducible protein OsmC [bacterium F16]